MYESIATIWSGLIPIPHVPMHRILQIGGLGIKCTRNMYGRQVSSFESPVKLHTASLHRPNAAPKHDECHGVFIRAPGVAEVCSPDVKILATLNNGQNTVVAVQQNNLIATTFHPELTDDMRWHAYFVDQIIEQRLSK